MTVQATVGYAEPKPQHPKFDPASRAGHAQWSCALDRAVHELFRAS